LTKGYLGDSAQFNASVFTSDGYFRTGDLGSLQQDGTLRYTGRSSEMIKRSGINVSPAEVEEILQQHPSVALAGVTGLADPAKGELIVAYLTAKPGASIDAAAVLEHCRKFLSRYKVPDRVYACEALPLTSTGKLMRRELRIMATKAAAT
jgi:acyl-coenzyme A synthetase/AMP-(fatty) acid ligase